MENEISRISRKNEFDILTEVIFLLRLNMPNANKYTTAYEHPDSFIHCTPETQTSIIQDLYLLLRRLFAMRVKEMLSLEDGFALNITKLHEPVRSKLIEIFNDPVAYVGGRLYPLAMFLFAQEFCHFIHSKSAEFMKRCMHFVQLYRYLADGYHRNNRVLPFCGAFSV